MTLHEVVAGVIGLVLTGFVAGWCAGWAGRGEQNRAWHHSAAWHNQQLRAELAGALDQLDAAHTYWQATRVPPQPAPAVVHVHVAAPLPWAPHPPVITTAGVPAPLAVLPAQELRS
ncbi:MAG: hypothetical protein ACRDRQ_16920 [Pseudonocardiaceae bacterium]